MVPLKKKIILHSHLKATLTWTWFLRSGILSHSSMPKSWHLTQWVIRERFLVKGEQETHIYGSWQMSTAFYLVGSEWKCLWMVKHWIHVEYRFCSHIQFLVFYAFRGVLFFASWYVLNFFYFSSKVCSIRPQTTAGRRLSQLLTLIACCLISLSLLPNGLYVGFRGQEGLWGE